VAGAEVIAALQVDHPMGGAGRAEGDQAGAVVEGQLDVDAVLRRAQRTDQHLDRAGRIAGGLDHREAGSEVDHAADIAGRR
jgi:hypothetical protein